MMICWTSLHVNLGLASRARAMIAAAIGALALVPVCFVVQPWCKSVVTICGSDVVPELEVQKQTNYSWLIEGLLNSNFAPEASFLGLSLNS